MVCIKFGYDERHAFLTSITQVLVMTEDKSSKVTMKDMPIDQTMITIDDLPAGMYKV